MHPVKRGTQFHHVTCQSMISAFDTKSKITVTLMAFNGYGVPK